MLHGHDPLFFTTMNAPAGVNAMWNTSLLLPALVMTPVTLLAGPLAAYNVLFILARLQFWGPLHQYGSPFTLGDYETDLRAFYVPSNPLWLTTRGSSAFAASYVPGAPSTGLPGHPASGGRSACGPRADR